ncbi:DUF4932 domain-containing protein [Porphyromonadaceae bacterium OttesenSCG-928-L07]|nr:DUF4932 domain-containing protein [Porphyromonadaceae bacterium OttesenSCG-928-L07]MDL2251461.1 DUF4932 domain-containing protein [Odoribacter sp. OttesenSCG-928-J03]MDL2282958.1 DUF4932 domain-containing protein [Odoribacter sp. OttesenSCG-928-G04]
MNIKRFVTDSYENLSLLACFVSALKELSQEKFITAYFSDTYPIDFNRLEDQSAHLKSQINIISSTLPTFMKGSNNIETIIVPTIHITPFTGYGSLFYDKIGHEISVSFFGLSLDKDDNKTTFDYHANMFLHESLHPYVTKVLDAEEYSKERHILEEYFERHKEAAKRTMDYIDSYSYFNETITRALEMSYLKKYGDDKAKEYVALAIEEDKGNFVLLEPIIELLENYFINSNDSFYPFWPQLVNQIIQIKK